MGVDFTAILDHQLTPVELYALPDQLNARMELPIELAPWVTKHVRSAHRRWEWKSTSPNAVAAELREQDYVRLDGPCGFHGSAFRQAVGVVHLARWWSFLYEPEVRLGLEAAVRRIASVAGAKHILYLPDNVAPESAAWDVILDGGTVQDALTWLHLHVGVPVSDVAKLPGPDEDDPYGLVWFYEPTG